MKKAAKITADDGRTKIEVRVLIDARDALTRDEVRRMAVSASRAIAQAIQSVPYSDFGVETMRVDL